MQDHNTKTGIELAIFQFINRCESPNDSQIARGNNQNERTVPTNTKYIYSQQVQLITKA